MNTLSLWNTEPLLKTFFGSNSDHWLDQPSHVPPCDIEEHEGFFLLSLDLPGMKKDEIDVSVDEDLLTISGERKSEASENKQGFQKLERFRGTFKRVFSLAEKMDVNKIEASYSEGVLQLIIPREKVVKPEKVKIKVGEKIH